MLFWESSTKFQFISINPELNIASCIPTVTAEKFAMGMTHMEMNTKFYVFSIFYKICANGKQEKHLKEIRYNLKTNCV
jgi:hypothetical protein